MICRLNMLLVIALPEAERFDGDTPTCHSTAALIGTLEAYHIWTRDNNEIRPTMQINIVWNEPLSAVQRLDKRIDALFDCCCIGKLWADAFCGICHREIGTGPQQIHHCDLQLEQESAVHPYSFSQPV